jgi:protein tyrosine phosphatase
MEVRVYPEEFMEPVSASDLIHGVSRDLGLEYRVLRYLTETAEMTERMRGFDREGRDRYRDIRPYVDNFLTTQDGCYVNASVVGRVIVGQAPVGKYISEWYSMLIKEKVRYIVCLTVEESSNRQCHRYWPKEVGHTEEYGRMNVSLQSVKHEGGYVRRSLQLSTTEGANKWLVEQIQYVQWPDHGVPDVQAAKTLVEQVMMLCTQGTVKIHCSAGVGRAGTLVAIMNCLAKVRETGKVSVMEEVIKLRQQRPLLVQTTAQYEFIYDVLRLILKT